MKQIKLSALQPSGRQRGPYFLSCEFSSSANLSRSGLFNSSLLPIPSWHAIAGFQHCTLPMFSRKDLMISSTSFSLESSSKLVLGFSNFVRRDALSTVNVLRLFAFSVEFLSWTFSNVNDSVGHEKCRSAKLPVFPRTAVSGWHHYLSDPHCALLFQHPVLTSVGFTSVGLFSQISRIFRSQKNEFVVFFAHVSHI